MCGSKGAIALAALAVCATPDAWARTPAFVRQTGLVCNQCHMTWTPTPDLTFTGMKFRLNGYRTPFVADKVEAGTEGAVNGQRLLLGLQNYWNLHYRSNLLLQSKSPSDPTLPEPEAAAVSTQPFTSVGLDYAGAVGEHFGIWTEYYFASGNGAGQGNTINFATDDEYDLRYVYNPGFNNIVGMFLSTQDITAPLWAAFSSGAPDDFNNVSVAGTRGHAPFAYLGVEGMTNDRAFIELAAQPGEDNLDFRRMNWAGGIGILPFNTDWNYLWLSVFAKAGNDQVPAVSSLSLAQGTNNIETDNAVMGVSALSASGQPYTSVSMGDGTHYIVDAHGGFLDHGPHSLAYAASVTFDNEKYSDGSTYDSRGIGAAVRYYYIRTYGVNFGLSKRLTWTFTDATGVTHPIPDDLGYNVLFVYRPAMNFAWEMGFSNSQRAVLDDNWRNGWSWNLQWHFLY